MLVSTFLFSTTLPVPVSHQHKYDGIGHQLILVNNCKENIWPGILGSAGQQTPKDGGFLLSSGQEVVIDVPEKWSGRIWGRQYCNFDSNGKGSCATGDCSGQLHCQGLGGTPPATVVEMTLGSSTSPLHFYDVSLVDGFNLPVSMKPVGGGIGCGVASCEVDLNICCPSALEVRVGGRVVGCKSACLAMQSAKYCCTESTNPKTCKPTLLLIFSRQFVRKHIVTPLMTLPASTSAELHDTSSLSALRNEDSIKLNDQCIVFSKYCISISVQLGKTFLTVVAAAGDVSAEGTTYLIAGAAAVALLGTAFPVLFSRKDLCPECDGAGFVRKSGSTLRANAARKDEVQIVCARCNGLGKLNQIDK
ncbi:UNVERIFIED_CONTAM: Thaumatin-like protein [Sesamum angustifolium]|uniref:Thaumatin-like protein n=1 Tax=Sesamum angustifolium TaxID=2727405 RepID=A0AAW2MPM1_9LAMI